MRPAHLIAHLQMLLKAVVVAKGDDIFVTAEQCLRAEKEFHLSILTDDDGKGFTLRLKRSLHDDEEAPGLQLPPPDLWTPGSKS